MPYDRPPLSKAVLAGELDPAAVALRPAGWYADRGVELLLGRAAVALHPERHELELPDGGVLRYDRLLIATGAEPGRFRSSTVHRTRISCARRPTRAGCATR